MSPTVKKLAVVVAISMSITKPCKKAYTIALFLILLFKLVQYIHQLIQFEKNQAKI